MEGGASHSQVKIVDLCNFCEQIKEVKRCTRCREVTYCSKECQKKDWKRGHKKVCEPAVTKDVRGRSKANNIAYIYSNTPAKDVLNLSSNEGKVSGGKFDVLLTGSCDIRDILNTVASLSDLYKDSPSSEVPSIEFVSLDANPQVISRQVLMLQIIQDMIGSHIDNDYSFDDVVQERKLLILFYMWYSTVLPKACAEDIMDRLRSHLTSSEDEIDHMNAVAKECLKISVSPMETGLMEYFSHIWITENDFTAADIVKEAAHAASPLDELRKTFPFLDQKDWPEVAEFGMTGAIGGRMLSGAPGAWPNVTMLAWWEDHLSYSLPSDPNPLNCWATSNRYGAPKELSLFQALKLHVGDIVRKFVAFVAKHPGKLTVQLACQDVFNCRELYIGRTFDRIYASNLADWFGFTPLLEQFTWLLKRTNSHAAIIMDAQNWPRAYGDPERLLSFPESSRVGTISQSFYEWLIKHCDLNQLKHMKLRYRFSNTICINWGMPVEVPIQRIIPEVYLELVDINNPISPEEESLKKQAEGYTDFMSSPEAQDLMKKVGNDPALGTKLMEYLQGFQENLDVKVRAAGMTPEDMRELGYKQASDFLF